MPHFSTGRTFLSLYKEGLADCPGSPASLWQLHKPPGQRRFALPSEMGGLTWHLHRAVNENRAWPSLGEEFLCCQSSPETPPREKMAFYCSQRVTPHPKPCFGSSLVHSQLCTYSCSSGSWQTSLSRNANITLAGTPKSAVILRSHKSTLATLLGHFLEPRLFSPKLLPHWPTCQPTAGEFCPAPCSASSGLPGELHTHSVGCLQCSVPWDCRCCITGRFIYTRKQHVRSSSPVWFKTL